MKKDIHRFGYAVSIVILLFIAYFMDELLGLTTNPVIQASMLGLRDVIHISLLIGWCVSLQRRIMNVQVRRNLVSVSILMIFWLTAKVIKYDFIADRTFWLGRYIWYSYYIPMILIPLLGIFIIDHMGKPESYQNPRRMNALYIPAFAILIGIFTNDLHEWAFRFHQGYEAGWDIYQRSVLYYAAVIWIFACIAWMIFTIVRRCRIPGTKKMIWLPITMLGVGVLYSILYVVDTQVFSFIEMTAALCFTVVAIWESCIKTGLIQSNSNYDELLKYSGLGVAVVDRKYTVHYRSDDALPLSKEQMKAAEPAPVMLDGGIRVSSSKIRGGHTLWQEDLSELIDILDELKELKKQLQGSNAVSMQNYQIDKRIRVLAEKNRLHDELHKETAYQIGLLNDWLKKLLDTKDLQEKRELLRHIVVVGAYLKRRNNMILVKEQDGIIKEEELMLSIQEMMKNLQLAGINCACVVRFDKNIPADIAMKLFDFYEYVVENAFDGLSDLLARFFCRGDYFYACVDAVCSIDLTTLNKDDVLVSVSDENCYTLSFKLKAGE